MQWKTIETAPVNEWLWVYCPWVDKSAAGIYRDKKSHGNGLLEGLKKLEQSPLTHKARRWVPLVDVMELIRQHEAANVQSLDTLPERGQKTAENEHVQREIRVVDDAINLKAALSLTKKYLDMIVGHKNKYTLTDKEVTELRETHYLIRDYLDEKKLLKPVSVDLQKCANAAHDVLHGCDHDNVDAPESYQQIAKAVLGAAGVTYGD